MSETAWDPALFSPLRHAEGGHLTWDDLGVIIRATEAYGWSLVVADKAGIDVQTERRRNDKIHGWFLRIMQGRPSQGGEVSHDK